MKQIEDFEAVTKEELYQALIKIRDTAYSPINDDWVWMDNRTPLGLFIDSVVQQVKWIDDTQN